MPAKIKNTHLFVKFTIFLSTNVDHVFQILKSIFSQWQLDLHVFGDVRGQHVPYGI